MAQFGGKLKKTLIQIALVVIILVIGAGVFKTLVSLRKPPVRKERQSVAPLVNAQVVHAENMQMTVHGYGTVVPRVEVQVVPQVSGVVVACHNDFVNGGFFKAGQPLITIDPRDYELAVQETEAAVARAQVQLEQELAEAAVASQEWQQLHPDSEPAFPLVLRRPQIRQAKAQLEAAKAQLAAAMLNLERTVISMPFDGRVARESIEPGQYLIAGQVVATVYGTDVVEIVVPLEDSELAWFDVPLGYTEHNKTSSAVTGSEVSVTADFAGTGHTWTGRVVRTEGQIDPTSRMVNVVVEVANPFELSNHRPPLVPGMFVEIAVKGKHLRNVFLVPRYAIHNGDELWVADDNRLGIRKVQIARRDKKYVYVVSGLEDGAVIVVSPLDTVTDRMKIRTHLISLQRVTAGKEGRGK